MHKWNGFFPFSNFPILLENKYFVQFSEFAAKIPSKTFNMLTFIQKHTRPTEAKLFFVRSVMSRPNLWICSVNPSLLSKFTSQCISCPWCPCTGAASAAASLIYPLCCFNACLKAECVFQVFCAHLTCLVLVGNVRKKPFLLNNVYYSAIIWCVNLFV